MTRRGISRGALAVWEVLAGAAAALAAGAVLWIFIPRTWLWYSLLWSIGLVYVAAAFGYLPLRYVNCCWSVGSTYVEYQTGVIFFTRRRMLKTAIMYATVVRDPLSPLLGTRTVVLSGMGGRMVIPFLPLRDAVFLMREAAPHAPLGGNADG